MPHFINTNPSQCLILFSSNQTFLWAPAPFCLLSRLCPHTRTVIPSLNRNPRHYLERWKAEYSALDEAKVLERRARLRVLERRAKWRVLERRAGWRLFPVDFADNVPIGRLKCWNFPSGLKDLQRTNPNPYPNPHPTSTLVGLLEDAGGSGLNLRGKDGSVGVCGVGFRYQSIAEASPEPYH
jgi:hypothetical protein